MVELTPGLGPWPKPNHELRGLGAKGLTGTRALGGLLASVSRQYLKHSEEAR